MNKSFWDEKLKNTSCSSERVELLLMPDCPLFLIELMVNHDVEVDVIQAGIAHPTCTDELRSIGEKRLKILVVNSSSDTICPIPWNHIAIQQNGDFRICCQNIYEPFGKLTDSSGTANISTVSINDVRNFKELKDLRKSMINGERNSLCNLCYNEEDLGLKSKRNHMLKIYKADDLIESTNSDGEINTTQFPLRYIDIRFGNLCNLKCRYCGPTDSSLWYEEFAEMSKNNSDTVMMPFYGSKTYEIKKVNNKWDIDSLDFKWYEGEKFWEQITKMIPYIDRYYFTGGEPTINKAHFDLLKLIIDQGYSKHTVLEYNSNMFAIPDKLYDMWSEFKDVGIGCSIDGLDNMANYLRPPSKWAALSENLDKLGYRPNKSIHGAIATTISVYNILHFLDITRWLLEKGFTSIKRTPSYHMLEGPNFMSVQVLPIEAKHYIKDQYELFYKEIDQKYSSSWGDWFRTNYAGILNYMFAEDRSSLLPQLKYSTTQLDELRNDKLDNHIKWLAKILQQIA
jgi:sulfatase maturation enzyme AslB (radical SAM superfamily)